MSIDHQNWVRQKWPHIFGYQGEADKVRADVASQRHSRPPGVMIRRLSDEELKVKIALADANFEIERESQERIVASQKNDNAVALKAAENAWIPERARLLAEAEKLFADMEKAYADRELPIEWIAVETALLRVILARAKAAIDIEKARLEAILAAIGSDVAGWLVELAQERLLTAERKAELIPFYQQLTEAKRELVEANMANIPIREALLGAREDIARKQADGIPLLQDQADLFGDLARATRAEISAREAILGIKLDQAVIGKDRAAIDALIAGLGANAADRDKIRANLDIAAAEHERNVKSLTTHFGDRVIAVGGELIPTREYTLSGLRTLLVKFMGQADSASSSAKIDHLEANTDRVQSTLSAREEATDSIQQEELDRHTESTDQDFTIRTEDAEADRSIDENAVDAQKETLTHGGSEHRRGDYTAADIRATATVTSELVHILSG